MIWTTTDDDPILDAVAATGLHPAIQSGPARPGLPTVGIDDRAAARAIGRVVFAGARRPAVPSFPTDRRRQRRLASGPPPIDVTFPVTRARWRGFLDAWSDLGGAPQRLRVAVCSHNSATCGEDLTGELLDSRPRPDAIAAMSDELALGVLADARRAEMAVPADLAVGGWDDTGTASRADLTTVAQSLRHQGRVGAEAVEDQPEARRLPATHRRPQPGPPAAAPIVFSASLTTATEPWRSRSSDTGRMPTGADPLGIVLSDTR